jgi:hypothetical protein
MADYRIFEEHLQRGILVALLVHSWPDFSWVVALFVAAAYAFYRCRVNP